MKEGKVRVTDYNQTSLVPKYNSDNHSKCKMLSLAYSLEFCSINVLHMCTHNTCVHIHTPVYTCKHKDTVNSHTIKGTRVAFVLKRFFSL